MCEKNNDETYYIIAKLKQYFFFLFFCSFFDYIFSLLIHLCYLFFCHNSHFHTLKFSSEKKKGIIEKEKGI